MNEISAEIGLEFEYDTCVEAIDLNLVEIFMAQQNRLKRIVGGLGLNTADSEDVLQNVSIKAMQNTAKFETKQDGVKWLVKVTVNECMAEHRRRKSFRKNANEILERKSQIQTSSSDKSVIAAEELEIVRQSLKKLDEDLLGPIVLRYFCDMNSNEISEVLEQNPSTIRGRLRDARMILAKTLLERGIEP
ncbi:MAG: sigma-70 family RNA polymerase sigma factor [Sedimentisphaerales bacterium]|nr:sigma-70 family RNA polymerase sigma factor [Sedimentisphaerales bacterium]